MHGKNVFLEKPITTKTEDAEKLRDAAVNNKLKIFVDYTQAFSEAMPIIKQYMHQLGKIEYIEMESKTLGRFMDHDVYWLLGSHYIYILDYLIGVKDMRFHADTYMRYRGLATTGVINFSRNDLSGKILLSTNSPIKNVKIIIYCEDGSIAYTPYLNETLCVCRYTKRRAATGPEMTTELIRRRFDENNNIRHSIRRFYDIICNGEDTNIDAAIRVTQILEAIN
jgi:predicted dehydrogenase